MSRSGLNQDGVPSGPLTMGGPPCLGANYAMPGPDAGGPMYDFPDERVVPVDFRTNFDPLDQIWEFGGHGAPGHGMHWMLRESDPLLATTCKNHSETDPPCWLTCQGQMGPILGDLAAHHGDLDELVQLDPSDLECWVGGENLLTVDDKVEDGGEDGVTYVYGSWAGKTHFIEVMPTLKALGAVKDGTYSGRLGTSGWTYPTPEIWDVAAGYKSWPLHSIAQPVTLNGRSAVELGFKWSDGLNDPVLFPSWTDGWMATSARPIIGILLLLMLALLLWLVVGM